MKRMTFLLSGLLLLASPIAAQELTLAVDVPTELSGTTYLANQTVRWSASGYALRFDGPAESLGPDVSIDALLLLEDGSFFFSADAPFTAGGFTYQPRDIVRFDGVDYSMHIAGGSLGLATSANVDALARDDFGRLVLSLDAPENLFGSQFMPADLLVYDQGDLSLLLDGVSMGLDSESDIAGLERDADGWYMLFAEPTSVDGLTFRPGDVARWDGVAFGAEHIDPTFPMGSAASGLSFPGSPAEVELLLLSKVAGGVELSWSASCSSEASDYSIYSGTLGDWTSHFPLGCGTSGATDAIIVPQAGDRYYLIVPQNGRYEGSYGRESSGAERASGLPSCQSAQRLGSCS